MNSPTSLVQTAISEGIFPGASFAISVKGKVHTGHFGNFTYCPDSPAVDHTTVWDLASVSKVVGTTSAVMLMVQDGLLDLNQTVASVIPEFRTNGKEAITFKNLMVHDSGLIAFRPYHKTMDSAASVMEAIYAEKLIYPTSSKSVYSDLNMILVGEAIRRLTGLTLDEFAKDRIFKPLGMKQTGYFRIGQPTMLNPVSQQFCAPTERIENWRKQIRRKRLGDIGSQNIYGIEPEYVQGEVHDPTATVLEGIAGHAGLFSTLTDLTSYLNNFTQKNPRLFSSSAIKAFTMRDSAKSSRALGWDTKSETGSSAGSYFGSRSYGHTGYTGTSIWVDPDAEIWAILLTNRVFPTSENTRIIGFRPRFHESIANIFEN